jgi:hypothetical protein
MILDPNTPIKPYSYGSASNLYALNYLDRECILIPFPHREMKHNFMLDFQYDGIDYSFHAYKEGGVGKLETRLSFHREHQCIYNVYLPDNPLILPLSAVSDLFIINKPNPNFTYLIAIPIN